MGARVTPPAVLLDVDVSSWLASLRTPHERIRAAVERCRAQGVRVVMLCEHHGVTLAPGGGWHVDHRARPPGVSLAGAVCIAFQGVIETDEPTADVTLAAADILGTSAPWVDGLLDGFGNQLAAVTYRGSARDLYRSGLDAGHDFRRELGTLCSCGTRHFKDEACPLCDLRSG